MRILFKSPNYLTCQIKDIDMKLGIVMGYGSNFNSLDSDGDIVMPGAFAKSIMETGPQSSKPRIKYLLDHKLSQNLGPMQVLKEDNVGLYYEAKPGTHNLGVDFMKMVDSGIITEHSFGYEIVRKEVINPDAKYYEQQTRLHELKLKEISALQCWGANMNTPLVGTKSFYKYAEERIPVFIKAIRNGTFTDKTFLELEKELLFLQSAIKSDYDTTEPNVTDDVSETTLPGDDDTKLLTQISLLRASIACAV